MSTLSTSERWLRTALRLDDDSLGPFPWQHELLDRLLRGAIPRALDLPTGLGKTSVIAVWLVARALGAPVPRRLVYVVDRRAVVDQSTRVAEDLRRWVDDDPDVKAALGLGERSLPISTLRGQFVDNREWLSDPAAPAIVVGTVDMVGSRLLFEGYGTSRKMRPYQAGLLGCDALFVLDEAHLVPPFEQLLETVTQDATLRARDPRDAALVPDARLLALSATGRDVAGEVLRLSDRDREHPVVAKRLNATKRLELESIADEGKLAQALAARAWALSAEGTSPVRCLVFANAREAAVAARAELLRLARAAKRSEPPCELFVGARRVYERTQLERWLEDQGFMAGSHAALAGPTFLFATSAAEVGVDLDADHLVCDLVAWERMVQRWGRVNRRGDGDARVVVVRAPAPSKAPASTVARLDAAAALLAALPRNADGSADASPGALLELKELAATDAALDDRIRTATTPAPLRPALTLPVLEAWSMTSLEEHTGRPDVQPWLRGWSEEPEPPRTGIVWRKHLPTWPGAAEAEFFEAAPPHVSEVLEQESYEVAEWLKKRAAALVRAKPRAEGEAEPPLAPDDVAAFVLDLAGKPAATLRLREIADRDRNRLERDLSGRTIVVDRRMGGLRGGLLDADGSEAPATADGEHWLGSPDAPVVRFRIRIVPAEATDPSVDPGWHPRRRFGYRVAADGEVLEWLLVEKWRDDAALEDDRAVARREQRLDEHADWTEAAARRIAGRLDLPAPFAEALCVAARLHDEGKRAARWQRAFRAPAGDVYAKTTGAPLFSVLDGYRHEFGSLPYVARSERFRALPPDLQDLALHLVAAHHGGARPVIATSGCDDAPPSALVRRAAEVALRFVRLQERWGPWGLAWWEALLRAADQEASRALERSGAQGGA